MESEQRKATQGGQGREGFCLPSELPDSDKEGPPSGRYGPRGRGEQSPFTPPLRTASISSERGKAADVCSGQLGAEASEREGGGCVALCEDDNGGSGAYTKAPKAKSTRPRRPHPEAF